MNKVTDIPLAIPLFYQDGMGGGIFDAEGHHIANIWNADVFEDDPEAEKYVVNAVNAHHDLVAALEKIAGDDGLGFYVDCDEVVPGRAHEQVLINAEDFDRILDIARDVLAKAGV